MKILYHSKNWSYFQKSKLIASKILEYFKAVQNYSWSQNKCRNRNECWSTFIEGFKIDHNYAKFPVISNLSLWCDGGARGNPGVSGSGTVIVRHMPFSHKMKLTYFCSYYHRQNETNNFAEYSSLLIGMRNINRKQYTSLTVYSDSQLLVYHLQGRYKKQSNGKLKPLLQQIRLLMGEFNSFSISHVYRQGNQCADFLANWAMDSKATTAMKFETFCPKLQLLNKPDALLYEKLWHFLRQDIDFGISDKSKKRKNPSAVISSVDRKRIKGPPDRK